jgi:hypothetical protein
LCIGLRVHVLELSRAIIPTGCLLFYWVVSTVVTSVKIYNSARRGLFDEYFWYSLLFCFVVASDVIVFTREYY